MFTCQYTLKIDSFSVVKWVISYLPGTRIQNMLRVWLATTYQS